MLLARERPDREVRHILLQLAAVTSDPREDRVVSRVRRDWQLAVKAFASREQVGSVVDRVISAPHGDVRLRVYIAEGADRLRPALVWIHGGGFVVGDVYTAGATARALASRSGTTVVAVEYRLAPEHSLDDGREDCEAVVMWLARHGSQLGIDPSRLIVGGDSAGGGIAALVAQHLARAGQPLAAQVLVYPATDLRSPPDEEAQVAGMLNPAWMSWFRAQVAQRSDLDDLSASALHADSLDGLPPTIILTAGFDPLRDEGLKYAHRLTEHGIPVRLLHYPGQIHGFITMDRVLSGGREALDRLGHHLIQLQHGEFEPGVDADLPQRKNLGLGWLHPRQRLHELEVGMVMVSERLLRVRGRHASDGRGAPEGGTNRRREP
jgi:acetyl esterase